MINTKDQEELFKLIAEYIKKDITCVAIGGTAMMFLKYKNTTKDIDLVFQSEKERDIFINAIEKLGYKEKALANIYDQKRKAHIGKPKMYSRGEERFDLFIKNIFGYQINFKNITLREDFLGKKELTILILSKEELILLKAITGREKDYEDIETILELEKDIDWKIIINSAIKQKKSNKWILIDLEETMQKLRKKYFIKEKYFKQIYNENIS